MGSEKKFDYDLFVIGAGSGGVRAARIAAGHGARVAIAEGSDMGGTCVNRGCVPKKLFVYSANMRRNFDDARGFGWTIFGLKLFSWKKLVANKDNEIKRLNGIYNNLLENAGADVFKGFAHFVDSNTLSVNGKEITAEKILIATGGKPRIPDVTGAEHILSSDDVFHLKSLPKEMLIIGGGYIAVEFACLFAALGSKVTLLNRSDTLLRGFDKDISEHLIQEMKKQNIHIIMNATLEKIEKSGNRVTAYCANGEQLKTTAIISAAGRVANTDQLNLEEIGLKTIKDGKIPVNKENQTNIKHIYALGDIANEHNLTPVALEEGHAFADRVFNGQKERYVDYTNIPTAVFSQPPIGTAGMSAQEARERGHELEIYKSSFKPMKHTLSGRDEKTLMKLIIDKKSRKILGIHMIGDDAPEIIQIAGVALKMGATKEDFDKTIGVHPTAAEEFVTMRTPSKD